MKLYGGIIYSAISPRFAMSNEVNGLVLDDVGPADEDARRTLCIRGYKAFGQRTGVLKRNMADIALNRILTAPFYEREPIVNNGRRKEVMKTGFRKSRL